MFYRFQSLIGILVGFDHGGPGSSSEWLVSIPDRDFSWFRLANRPALFAALALGFQSLIGILVGFDTTAPINLLFVSHVSIPDRDFSWFRQLLNFR